MKIRMIKTTIIAFFFIIAVITNALCQQTNCYIFNGETFPDIIFQSILSKQHQKYLGISDSHREIYDSSDFYSFTIRDTEADLVIIELINVHCFSCEKQAPIMNAIYNLIEIDNNLKNKIRMIGVCPGNTFQEVEKFKNQYSVPFPLIPDPQFEIYEAVGNQCGTPFILMARKNKQEHIITWSHLGSIADPLYFMQKIWDSLNIDIQRVVEKTKEKAEVKTIIKKPKPYITDEIIKHKILASLERQRLNLLDLKKISLSNNQDIFVGKAKQENKITHFFTKLISQNPICDICHSIHFILMFDEKGIILDFMPIHITKHENVLLSLSENIKLRKRLTGKSILEPLNFDPRVDAISQATMSSALIFYSVGKTSAYYEELEQKGYINKQTQ
jgi:hypothetical protein